MLGNMGKPRERALRLDLVFFTCRSPLIVVDMALSNGKPKMFDPFLVSPLVSYQKGNISIEEGVERKVIIF
jgi:hypothetical protein